MNAQSKVVELIQVARRSNRGLTFVEAAARATRMGHPISKSYISEILAQGMTTITRAKVAGIAAGFGIPADEVARAAMEDLGFPLNSVDLSPERAIRNDPTLSIETKAILVSVLETVRAASGGQNDDLTPAPAPAGDGGVRRSKGG